jgi:hypothetical protein
MQLMQKASGLMMCSHVFLQVSTKSMPTVIDQWVHRQNVEVTNAERTKRRMTKCRMGQNAE